MNVGFNAYEIVIIYRTETNIFPKELPLQPLVEAQQEDNRYGADQVSKHPMLLKGGLVLLAKYWQMGDRGHALARSLIRLILPYILSKQLTIFR